MPLAVAGAILGMAVAMGFCYALMSDRRASYGWAICWFLGFVASAVIGFGLYGFFKVLE